MKALTRFLIDKPERLTVLVILIIASALFVGTCSVTYLVKKERHERQD